MILTIAVCPSIADDAGQLARCIGQSAHDDQTFAHGVNAEDAAGHRYIVASGWVGPDFLPAAMAELSEPPWGCDMDAARRAQSAVALEQPAAPGRLSAWPLPVPEALAAMGLVLTQEEPQ